MLANLTSRLTVLLLAVAALLALTFAGIPAADAAPSAPALPTPITGTPQISQTRSPQPTGAITPAIGDPPTVPSPTTTPPGCGCNTEPEPPTSTPTPPRVAGPGWWDNHHLYLPAIENNSGRR